jgi:hypothetical protein
LLHGSIIEAIMALVRLKSVAGINIPDTALSFDLGLFWRGEAAAPGTHMKHGGRAITRGEVNEPLQPELIMLYSAA